MHTASLQCIQRKNYLILWIYQHFKSITSRPGLDSFFLIFKIFSFLISLFRVKTQINSLCSLDDPPSQGSRWDRHLSGPGWPGWRACSVLVLASCSKLITWGYFPTVENVNITPRERCGSPPAAFLFMSFNSINGLLSPWAVLLLLYLYFL